MAHSIYKSSLLLYFTSLLAYMFVTPIVGQCRFYTSTGAYTPMRNITDIDRNLIEFALNLEFLEAEFFLWGALGYGLDQVAPQLSRGGPSPIGAQIANLDPFTRNLTLQFAFQEVGHLRAILSTVPGFPRPSLNLSLGVWQTIMNQAFGRTLQPAFNPYEDGLKYMIASYAIPYVGLTGYVGAAIFMQSIPAKRLVAGLLGVESGQDAVIRTFLYRLKDLRVEGYTYTVGDFTNRISQLRARLGNTGIVDEGVVVPDCLGAEGHTSQNVLVGDPFSVSYSRFPHEILRIVYGTGSEVSPGGFYPTGARGVIANAFLRQGSNTQSSSSTPTLITSPISNSSTLETPTPSP